MTYGPPQTSSPSDTLPSAATFNAELLQTYYPSSAASKTLGSSTLSHLQNSFTSSAASGMQAAAAAGPVNHRLSTQQLHHHRLPQSLHHPPMPAHHHHQLSLLPHQLQIPTFNRLTEGASGGVSPRNIYSQSAQGSLMDEGNAGASKTSTKPTTSSEVSTSAASTPAPAATPTPLAPPMVAEGEIYSAVYSGIGVYEMMANGVAVMRRKSDGYLNATQILKVANVDKGRRTKILDKEVMIGEHEKVQGGYGKYQGTWVPFARGVQLAQQYGVETPLQPMFDFAFPAPGRSDHTPTKEQVYAANRDFLKSQPPKPKEPGEATKRKKTRMPKRLVEIVEKPDVMEEDTPESTIASPAVSHKRQKIEPDPDAYVETNAEKYRAMLMAMFVHEDPHYIPDILSGTTLPSDLDLDNVIDEQGHTSLHWAAALARINVVRVLLQRGANIRSVNNDGETPLIRAVRVTNNYDTQTFPELLDLLHPTIPLVDGKNRTVLHHIAATAGLEGRVAASRYYAECFLEWVARHTGNFSSIVDVQDIAGDTPLNVAARIGSRNLVEQLMEVGADPNIENKAGLRPMDFGFEDVPGMRRNSHTNPSVEAVAGTSELERPHEGASRVVFPSIRTDDEDAALALSQVASATKGREIASAVQQMVDEMSTTFTDEMQFNVSQLDEIREQLRQVTRELAEVRKVNHSLRKENRQLPDLLSRIRELEENLGREMARSGFQDLSAAQNPTDSAIPFTVGGAPASLMDVPAPGGMVSYLSHDGPVSPGSMSTSSHPLAEGDDSGDVESLRRTLEERARVERSLRAEILQLRSSTPGVTERSCKQIIAACCRVPFEQVDALLKPLLEAVESDQDVDTSAVAAFMMAVKRREGAAAM